MTTKRLLLDTANHDDITRLIKSSAIAGVTTNPSLMAKEEKGDYKRKLHEIAVSIAYTPSHEIRHLSVEVTTLDPVGMIMQADDLKNSLHFEHIKLFVKIPVMLVTLPVITKLVSLGVNVNATACMTALQAKMADDAGAQIVSFFYNRIKDGGGDPKNVIKEYCQIRGSTEIICGSIREPDDIYQAWLAGADYVTASPQVIEKMIQHPQTDKAIGQFQRDIDAWLK
jgi:TalC/MipB family fructose-6-phosphate aldolase